MSRKGLIALGVVAVLAAGCGKSVAPSSSESSVPGTTSQTTSPSGTTTTTTTNAPTTPQNESVSDADKQALTAAFVAFRHFPAQDIAGTQSGSVYDAYVPSTSTYWALARFTPSATASQQTLVGLQDGGEIGIFTKSGSSWTMLAVGGEPFCPSNTSIPASVRQLWGLSDPPACASTTTTG